MLYTNAYTIQAPIKWEPVDVTPQLRDGKTVIPQEAIDSITRNFVALKGPLAVRLPRLINLDLDSSLTIDRRPLVKVTSH